MKKANSILVFILIVIILLLAFYFWAKTDPFYNIIVNQPLVNASLEEKTADWDKYENSRYGFSVKFPADWELGEAETNNAGREFYPSDKKAACYAYGYENALTNDQGDPQSLGEFVDWLVNDGRTKVIMREDTKLDERGAIYIQTGQDSKVKEAVYALGTETGRGLFCVYDNLKDWELYKEEFKLIRDSFKIQGSLDGEEQVSSGFETCENMLNGVVVPFRDFQTLTDDQYTGVTLTSRENWDKNLLPKQVLDLQDKGYSCFPMPLEFDESTGMDGAERAVTKVIWDCELEYDDYKYLSQEHGLERKGLEDDGYSCEEVVCFFETGSEGLIWLCFK